MATVTKPTTVRFSETDKAAATDILKGMGLSLNSYLNLSVRQLIIKRKIPFEIDAADEEPTEETRRTMVGAEARELGIVEDDSPSFRGADALMDYLEN